MTTGPVKWFSDDKGFASSSPTTGLLHERVTVWVYAA